MRGVYITSKNNNLYFYNDKSGYIELCHDIVDENNIKESIPNKSEEIKHCTKEHVEKYLYDGYGFIKLILEVTQSCNLRCKYCVYSDNYQHTRTHCNKWMSIETAKAGIDFYMNNFNKIRCKNLIRKPVISFYGGEPLLNFDLIKQCVEYINKKYDKYEINYDITTNGLLLKDDVCDFLVKNNFSIVVSLDGNKDNHDRNRVKANGSGSFDEVYTNLMNFRNKYPKYKKIALSMCYDYYTNLVDVSKFIEENNLGVANIAKVSPENTDYYNKFTQEDRDKFNENLTKLEEEFLELLKNNKDIKGLHLSLLVYRFVVFLLHSVQEEPSRKFLPYTASCVPGEKMLISVDGHIHTCERINTNFSIGNVNTGFDYDKICHMIDKMNKIQSRCKNCNVSKLCNICYAKVATDKDLIVKEDICNQCESDCKKLFKSYIDLMEDYPKEFTEIVNKYFLNVNEFNYIDLC